MKKNLAENERALWLLKSNGPQCLGAIACDMKITIEGARFHLLKLANEGLVEATQEAKGRGRPQQLWSLTQAGHDRFPDSHAELSVKLIHLIREKLGEEALEMVMAENEKNGIQKYSKELAGIFDLESKVNRLAQIRNQEGYMASSIPQEDGSFLLIENHCPICEAAKACQRFCRSEWNTFQQVLGDDVSITREEHILSGARRCVYRITIK